MYTFKLRPRKRTINWQIVALLLTVAMVVIAASAADAPQKENLKKVDVEPVVVNQLTDKEVNELVEQFEKIRKHREVLEKCSKDRKACPAHGR